MPEYRTESTGCKNCFIVRMDGGVDTKRLCRGNEEKPSEWMEVGFCDFCRDREVEL